jgi:hypothetical protein
MSIISDVTIRGQRGEIVIENEWSAVIRILIVVRPLVARAQIAFGVEFGQLVGIDVLKLSLPRSLQTLRRHQQPLPG